MITEHGTHLSIHSFIILLKHRQGKCKMGLGIWISNSRSYTSGCRNRKWRIQLLTPLLTGEEPALAKLHSPRVHPEEWDAKLLLSTLYPGITECQPICALQKHPQECISKAIFTVPRLRITWGGKAFSNQAQDWVFCIILRLQNGTFAFTQKLQGYEQKLGSTCY